MEPRQRTQLIGSLIALMVLAVGVNVVLGLLPKRAPQRLTVSEPATPPSRPAPTRSRAGTDVVTAGPPEAEPGYLDLVARAEIRRRIRASFPYTYLSAIVAASSDSMLHRWDDRFGRPVRVYLAPDSVAGFQPGFLEAVREAFARWERAGVAVRFDLTADSGDAEVRFAWLGQFDMDRTGQTDLEWDGGGHVRSGRVTIATHDPRGHPLGPDDVRVVALHEIGHLIGLDHSPDSTDVMFAKTVLRDLSERDIRTAKQLYDLAPGSLR